MSIREWYDYHLTPRGWEAGSVKRAEGAAELVAPPPDRVLTRRRHEYIASGCGALEQWVTTEWESCDLAARDRLLAQYGPLADE